MYIRRKAVSVTSIRYARRNLRSDRLSPSHLPTAVPATETEAETAVPGGRSPQLLPSDTTYRLDSLTLERGDVEAAQLRKNEMEEVQRNDRKLREAAAKRREKGGPKISREPYRK